MNSAHRISDSTPSTMARVTGWPWPAAPRDRFAKRVERRGADIAEHDADAAERQGPKTGMSRSLMGLVDVTLAVMTIGERLIRGFDPVAAGRP